MTTFRFAFVAVVSSSVAAVSLALAAALDCWGFYVPALLAIAIVLASREAWLWHGDGRRWLLMVGTLGAALIGIYLLSRLAAW